MQTKESKMNTEQETKLWHIHKGLFFPKDHMCCQDISPVTRSLLSRLPHRGLCLFWEQKMCMKNLQQNETESLGFTLIPEKSKTIPACFYVYVIIWIIIYTGIFYQILLIGVTSRNKEKHCNWVIVPCFLRRIKSPPHLGTSFRASAYNFYHEISPELSRNSLFVLRWEAEMTWIVCPWTK